MSITNRARTFALLTVSTAALAGGAIAASSGGGAREREATSAEGTEAKADEADQMYQRGMELAEAGKFEEALVRFEQANKKRKNDAEILNMLAFCQRKTGDLEHAFENYGKALEIRPDFPQAREYLGEAHLQAALQQVEILRGYGAEGEKELGRLVAAVKMAAGEAVSGKASESGW
ncbi:MAG: tetratricopeptide repeat protein [Candidatus Eiseniibacteriota bacterium]